MLNLSCKSHRYKFFANRSERTCPICSGPRKGRSLFRAGTRHADRLMRIRVLQHTVDGDTRGERKRVSKRQRDAGLSLERKGLHSVKRCRLPDRCPRSMLTPPGRIFGGLAACDVMHAIFINCCSYYLSGVQDVLTPSMKRLLDQRMDGLWGRFRDPDTGQTSRAPKGAMTSQTGLTAELRVQVVFMMIHVLGSQASFLNTRTHERVREHVVMAGSSLVLILTAVRKKRPYTNKELDEIFGPVCMKFFHALDSIKHWDNSRKVHDRRMYNIKHPDSPKKLKQFVCDARDPLDSSENSTDEEWRSLAGFYDRCGCIIPHFVVRHFKQQVLEYFTWVTLLAYVT